MTTFHRTATAAMQASTFRQPAFIHALLGTTALVLAFAAAPAAAAPNAAPDTAGAADLAQT